MTRLLVALAAVLLAALVSGCGPAAPPRPPADLRVTSADVLGDVVTDGQGRTLYRFDLDSPSASNCFGACASRWPPAVAGAAAPATDGIAPGLAGVLVRPDGVRQLTLAGWPLYRYLNDTAPGQANGQGVDGTWFAVTPAGAKATATPPATSGDSGFGY
ncbi:hypothetical protein [Amycolatopsis thermophila]|uniref:Lipoprotein with Yx(FWY)xxD motif n=1 Tax=Amycolatopsis thermophila TaxID=206084 RepID=A0ABU0F3Y2_9PSEU|nr:hypothetical protein [Amycolatopsis thermophila]MDQ0382198.1 putative lipoprotein with Yx(FWY)xxD motif [Amycolatopsis thermophila]